MRPATRAPGSGPTCWCQFCSLDAPGLFGSGRESTRESQAMFRRVCRPSCLERHHRSEEHTSELQSLMRISYAVFCLKKKTTNTKNHIHQYTNELSSIIT